MISALGKQRKGILRASWLVRLVDTHVPIHSWTHIHICAQIMHVFLRKTLATFLISVNRHLFVAQEHHVNGIRVSLLLASSIPQGFEMSSEHPVNSLFSFVKWADKIFHLFFFLNSPKAFLMWEWFAVWKAEVTHPGARRRRQPSVKTSLSRFLYTVPLGGTALSR